MDAQEDLEYAYGWNRYTMEFMGIWPEERRWSRASSYKVLVPVLLMLCFVCGPQSINLRYVWGDVELIVDNLCLGNITITISLLKTIIFWSKGKSLKSLLAKMADEWNGTAEKADREALLKIGWMSRSICNKSTLMSQSVVLSYVLFQFMSMRNKARRLLYEGYFPFETGPFPNYQIVFLGQLLGAMYAAATYTCVDTFVAMLVLHACGQLASLRKKLKNLSAQTHTKFTAKLGGIVRKQQDINKFAEVIEDCFNKMLLMQMLGCTMQLCLQVYMVTTSSGDVSAEILILRLLFLGTYFVYVMLQLYLYCYVGERLLIESTEISYAAYECEWYNFSINEAKLLIIIMARARSPLQISAGRFCSFTLQLFSEVVKKSMGYVSFLYAMKDKI